MKLARICLNWEVLVGLAVVGLGVWIVAPSAFLTALPVLLLAACPFSMLVMMWAIRHNNMGVREEGLAATPVGALSPEARLAGLEAEKQALEQQIAVAKGKKVESAQSVTPALHNFTSPDQGLERSGTSG